MNFVSQMIRFGDQGGFDKDIIAITQCIKDAESLRWGKVLHCEPEHTKNMPSKICKICQDNITRYSVRIVKIKRINENLLSPPYLM